MQTLTIEVTQDHIDDLAKARKPIFGLTELIWNGVDADATEVTIRLNRNRLDAIDNIVVVDNGLGITMSDAQTGFGRLGGSWKRTERQTMRDKRILHGKHGQGRFRAFAVCDRIEWDTSYLSNGSLKEFTIIGTTQNKRQFTITDEQPGTRDGTGTIVTLSSIIARQSSLDADRTVAGTEPAPRPLSEAIPPSAHFI
jgi:HSP90 family molecular chaperone